MKSIAFVSCCILFVGACGVESESKVVRSEPYTEDLPPVPGAPARFVVDPAANEPPPDEIGECPARLVDAGGVVRLRISESQSTSLRRGDTTVVRSYGDYFVEPKGSFGLGADETLRIEFARYALVGRTP